MIPLRSTEGVEKFPQSSLWLCLGLLIINLSFYIFHFSLGPLKFILSPSLWNLAVNLLFLWVFCPRLFERTSIYFLLILAGLSSFVAYYSFFKIHPQYEGPLLCLDAFTGALIGASLRKEIWSTVTTLVVGLGWIRLFEVPSYVLLFFWLFYLFLGNLFLKEPYSLAPMLYWLAFVGLGVGFIGESLFEAFKKFIKNK